MSGWQRIGVVISIIWLIGFPIYSMIDQKNRVGESYANCYGSAYKAYGPGGLLGDQPDKLKAREDGCAYLYRISSPQKLVQLLIGADKDSWIFWLIILVPLALFWIIGGIVFGTLRWIGGGFRARKI